VSKVWYAEAWADGSTAAPDCFSTNGIVPDNSVDPSKRQAHACANCPKNAWGSQIKADGTAGKGKACSDSKRLAVVPLNDLKNDFLGGPMMLRVPAASLQDLATYGDALQKMGFPYCAVGTRISFDTKESYPKFVFGAIRPLNDAEADIVLAHLEDPVVDRILAEIVEQAQPAPQQPAPVAFEQPPAAQQERPLHRPHHQPRPLLRLRLRRAPVVESRQRPSRLRRLNPHRPRSRRHPPRLKQEGLGLRSR